MEPNPADHQVALEELSLEDSAKHFNETFNNLKSEVSRFIVGHQSLIEEVLIAVVCGGHVLLEGVPGLGKTALVHSIAQAMDLNFQRIQFTPDLLPADIVGTQILMEQDSGHKAFTFQPGPVFCNVLLADEINRATPKTQSALLETMQEKSVTVAGATHQLQLPFFTLATQNPIEQEGTYPLPEAQLDRFFFKLHVELPTREEFSEILDRTCGTVQPELKSIANGEDILFMGKTSRQVPIDKTVQDYLVKIVRATHPGDDNASDEVTKYVRHGASPRGAQAILSSAKVRALLEGRFHVAREDIERLAKSALRHRMILSFEGEAEGISTDKIIESVIAKVSS
ncbi:MAG: MoxR family ATPase [Verrucomicrobiota bacterium]